MWCRKHWLREQGWYRDDSSLCVVRHTGIFCVNDQMACVHEMMATLHQAEKSADYFQLVETRGEVIMALRRWSCIYTVTLTVMRRRE